MDKTYDYRTQEIAAQTIWEQEAHDQHHATQSIVTIDTPPPTISGSLHIGHIFSYTHTDIIARHQRLSGHIVRYPFGFDDNGLPTERYVEKKTGVRAHTMKRSEFIALCSKETQESAAIFTALWKRMGISADWHKVYSTISPETRKISQQSFLALLTQKDVYRHQEAAIYCTTCRTSVAQAELDDAMMPSSFNTILFTGPNGISLPIATTRPELLPSCVALVYHPTDTRYQQLRDQHAIVPLFNNHVIIKEDELVDPAKGTGLVMVCTFGDKTDIEWYKKHALEYRPSIGHDGKILAHIPLVGGLTIAQARTEIVRLLQEQGILTDQRPITHSVSVHERCKKPVEYMLLHQWFVKILAYKQALLAAADAIIWHPSFMKSRYINWVENISWDWGISRQRFFGIPFPVWHCLDCHAILPAREDQLPVDPQDTPYATACPHCASDQIAPDTDVMDTWNTSSLTPYICAQLFDAQDNNVFINTQPPASIPMTIRPQAHDIIRTWAFDTIVKTYLHHRTIPWRNIIISGHVLSDQKEKISKSQSNATTDPHELIARYGADAVRYWTASGALGQDTAFSLEQIKLGQRLVTKLWNAFLFLSPHVTDDTRLSWQTSSTDGSRVNDWMLQKLSACTQRYHEHLYTKYEFSAALQAVDQLFWQDFCNNYIELIKHQLFNPQEYQAEEVIETRNSLYTIGFSILQLYAPFIPHVTEIIYQQLYRATCAIPSLHMTKLWYLSRQQPTATDVSAVDRVVHIATAVRKLKTEQQLSLKTELATLEIITNNAAKSIPVQEYKLIRGVTQAQQLTIVIDASITTDQLAHRDDGWRARVVLQHVDE